MVRLTARADYPMQYAELHCHSTFSLLDGASHPERLVERARELGLHAVAITDHDELGGVVRFARAAAEHAFNGIIGTELTVEQPESARDAAGCGVLTHLVLLAQNATGYGNISTLITRARMDHPRGRPQVSLDRVAAHADGVFALSGCARGWVRPNSSRKYFSGDSPSSAGIMRSPRSARSCRNCSALRARSVCRGW